MIQTHDVDRDGQPCVSTATAAATRSTRSAVGIEDLAELAALVEVARDVAVDPVGRAEHREQDSRAAAGRVRPHSSQRNSGTQSQPPAEMTFGIVRTRDSRGTHRGASVRLRASPVGYETGDAAFGTRIGAGAVARRPMHSIACAMPGPCR